MLIDCHVHLDNYHETARRLTPGRQLMYGSNWPLVRMGPYVKFLANLELPEGSRENVAWATAARLFKIDVDAVRAAPPLAKPEG